MKWDALTRRHFLQGPGKAALALPVLHSLLPKSAQAQVVQKNFFGFPMLNGVANMYNTSAAESATKPSVYLPNFLNMQTFAGPAHQIQYKTLATALADGNNAAGTNKGGQISEMIGPEFNPYLPKMNFLHGFDWFPLPSDHHHAHFGNAAADGAGDSAAEAGIPHASIDQVMAYSNNFYKNPAMIGKSVHWSNYFEGLDYFDFSHTYANAANKLTSAIQNKPALTSPASMWDTYFKTFTPPPVGAPPPPVGPSLRSLLVDQVLADYTALTKSSKLGSADKARIDQHIAMLHQTEKSVKAVVVAPSPGCKVPTRPGSTDIRKNAEVMNSIAVAIASCGLANSFIGSFGAYVSTSGCDWHTWSHGNGSNPVVNEHDQIKLGMSEVVLDLVKKLDGAGLLDTSLVIVPNEHTRGTHSGVCIPVVTFGSAGGVLKTGQYIDYRNMASASGDAAVRHGYPMNQMFANMLMAMDVPASEFEALNRSTNSHFGPANSGYGHLPFKSATPTSYARFKGQSLSAWLPMLKA